MLLCNCHDLFPQVNGISRTRDDHGPGQASIALRPFHKTFRNCSEFSMGALNGCAFRRRQFQVRRNFELYRGVILKIVSVASQEYDLLFVSLLDGLWTTFEEMGSSPFDGEVLHNEATYYGFANATTGHSMPWKLDASQIYTAGGRVLGEGKALKYPGWGG